MDSIWYEILVITLAFFLLVFLILFIILLKKLIDIANQVKRVTDKAEQVADKAENIASFFEKTTAPVAIMKLVSNFSDAFAKKSKRRKND